MNAIARSSAPGAVLLMAEMRWSHLVVLLCLMSVFAISQTALSVPLQGCGNAQAAPARFIVRAKAAPSADLRNESDSLIQQLIREKPERVLHRTTVATHLAQNLIPSNAHSASMSRDSAVITLASELSNDQVSSLQNNSSVLSIEQDCIVQIDALPNDPVPAQYLFSRASLNLEKAWDLKTDSSNIVVAVSDTGVDLKHEDLQENLWTNRSELNGQAGIDDDGNGCIDDIHGCDFGDRDGDPSPVVSSEGGHGTHVAGLIGAVGNNSVGVNGVTWKAQLMAVKGFDSGGQARVSDLLSTVYYAVNNGARVINCSWGTGRPPNPSEIDAFNFALSNGVLPVVAAGNSSLDAAGFSPAGIEGVLTVGSVNSSDQVSGFSNFGSHVAVYAPGGDAVAAGGARDEFIYSTLPTNQGGYGIMRGTSMAAPFVTGLAALVFSLNPKLDAVDVKQIIVSTARHVNSKLPNGESAVILIPDAEAALKLAQTYKPTPFTVTTSPTGSSYFNSNPESSGPHQPTAVDAHSLESSSAASCALRRTRAPVSPATLFIFLLPLVVVFKLKKVSPETHLSKSASHSRTRL